MYEINATKESSHGALVNKYKLRLTLMYLYFFMWILLCNS